MAPTPGPRLTIGQAASYAGLTTRAVRHYHQLGLVPEPPRDSSGYRRYGAHDVIDLLRIRALANAGVPLHRVGALLSADRDELAVAVGEIDEQLQDEIRRLEANRVAVAQLTSADGLALPDEVVAYLDVMRDLGFSERTVAVERDTWVLVSARAPDHVTAWIADKRAALEDPVVLDAYRGLEEAIDWDPSDPRLEGLADRLEALFARDYAAYGDHLNPEEIDDTTAEMIDAESMGRSPAWQRVVAILAERGWRGWTNIRPPEGWSPHGSER